MTEATVSATPDTPQRVLWAVAYAALLYYAQTLLRSSPPSVVEVTALVALALAALGIATALLASADRAAPWHMTALSVTTLVVALTVRGLHPFSDETLFFAASGRLLRHGVDPYGVNLVQSWPLLHHLPDQYFTNLLDGTHVTQLAYPAGALGPLWAIGWFSPLWAPVILAILAWVAAGLAAYWLLPRPWRAVAGLLVTFTPLLLTYTAGVGDAMLVAPLVVALGTMRHVTATTPNWRRWISPVALGLAVSVKPTPAVFLPFILVSLVFEVPGLRAALRRAATYLAAVAGAFLVVNAPFILWGFTAWRRAILIPLTAHLQPSGVGVVSLFTSGVATGVHLNYLSLAGLLVLAGTGIALFAWYDHLRIAWPMLVSLFFLVEPRSYWSYVAYPFVAGLVYALTLPARPATSNRPTPDARFAPLVRPARLLAVAALVAGALTTVGAFLPATIDVTSVHWTTSSGNVDQVTATLSNHLATPQTVVVRPFSPTSGISNAAWMVDIATGSNRVVLAPHSELTVTLRSSTPEVPTATPWFLEAATTSQIVRSPIYGAPPR